MILPEGAIPCAMCLAGYKGGGISTGLLLSQTTAFRACDACSRLVLATHVPSGGWEFKRDKPWVRIVPPPPEEVPT